MIVFLETEHSRENIIEVDFTNRFTSVTVNSIRIFCIYDISLRNLDDYRLLRCDAL
jgi:hypothetical protein